MYASLALTAVTSGAGSFYFLVKRDGNCQKIFPVFVFTLSMFIIATNKLRYLLLKSVSTIHKNTYLGLQKHICSKNSLWFRLQCVYFVILNIPSCFIGFGIDRMLLAFGPVYGLAGLEIGFVNLSVLLHLLEKLKESSKTTVRSSSKSHCSRIRKLKLIFVACACLIFAAELFCGFIAVWRIFQLPLQFVYLMIGFDVVFSIHVIVSIFPSQKQKRAAFENKPLRYRWNTFQNKKVGCALQHNIQRVELKINE